MEKRKERKKEGKKVMKSNYKVQKQEGDISGSETEPTVYGHGWL